MYSLENAQEQMKKRWNPSKNVKKPLTKVELVQEQEEMKKRWKLSETVNNLRIKLETETYFIQGKLTGLIKIGKTSRGVKERRGLLQIGSPDKLHILKFIKGDREEVYHEKFAHLREHGEWFRPAPELLEFIEGL